MISPAKLEMETTNKVWLSDGNSTASSQQLFDSALNIARNALSPEDQKYFRRFNDHREMIKSLREHTKEYSLSSSKLKRCAGRIASFSNAFSPFLDVVGVFVQVKPEWTAMLWGTILFIFKLGTNFVTFLERVSDMFGDLTYSLPRYTQWYDICRSNPNLKNSGRLGQALGIIYYDVVQFSVHIWFLFSRQDKGRIKRALMGTEMMLKPFESRFSQLRERLHLHMKWFENESTILNQRLLREVDDDFRKYVQEAEKNKQGITEAEQRRFDDEMVRNLKRWVGSPDYTTLRDDVKHKIQEGTGKWMLQLTEFRRLKTMPFTEGCLNPLPANSSQWQERVLLFTAKPGFGKTCLSVGVIEDLAQQVLPSGEFPTVALFHFNKLNRRRANTSEEAMRAVAEQLIHSHRRNRISLDALSLIERDTGSGQYNSSRKDIHTTIDILLRQHPIYIVIDGVDECHDAQRLLEDIRKICMEHDCHVVLFARPDIELPHLWPRYSACNPVVSLEGKLIQDDISSFLQVQIRKMIDERFFGHNIRNVDDLLSSLRAELFTELSKKAQGLFLWARLLVNFLWLPVLTFQERRDIVKDPGYLEGLDALYKGILGNILNKDEKTVSVARRVINWIAFSAMQLTLDAFEVALVITPGRALTPQARLAHYPQCIPIITSSLVEVSTTSNSMTFIHLKFQEFVISVCQKTTSMSMHESQRNLGRPLRPSVTFSSSQQALSTGPRGYPELEDAGLESEDVSGFYTGFLAPSSGSSIIPQQQRLAHRGFSPPTTFPFKSVSDVHFELAEACLSYLALDIPSAPLVELKVEDASGTGTTSHNEPARESALSTHEQQQTVGLIGSAWTRDFHDREHPFLRYAALFWYHHLATAHSYSEAQNLKRLLKSGRLPMWVTLLSHFLVDRLKITAWVEAAYTYTLVPKLAKLLPLVGYLGGNKQRDRKEIASSAEERECNWVYVGLWKLNAALDHLAATHAAALWRNPTLIWQKTIVASVDNDFWPVWEHPGSELRRRSPGDTHVEVVATWGVEAGLLQRR